MQVHCECSPDSISSLSYDGSFPEPVLAPQMELNILREPPIPVPKLAGAISLIQSALDNDIAPTLLEDCTGGTYFCYSPFASVEAVFKPFDEEPYCLNNPKGLPPSKFSPEIDRGIVPGTAALREAAAFYLDHGHFAGVPETLLVSLSSVYMESHKNGLCSERVKEGSLQLFVPNECSSEDYGPALFSVTNVQRIAILDMRLLNLDRHANNLLVTRQRLRATSRCDDLLDASKTRASTCRRSMSISTAPCHDDIILVPIDHGYSLPVCTTKAVPEWCWRYWYQSQIGIEESVKEYVRNLDIEKDIALLKSHIPELEEEAIWTLRISTMWLKLGVEAGLTIQTLSSFYFPRKEELSGFQQLVRMYHESLYECFDSFLKEVGVQYMRQLISTCNCLLDQVLEQTCVMLLSLRDELAYKMM